MIAAVEGHVLDQVREALLIVGLVDRPGLDGQPHRDPLRGPIVVADEVLQAVRQRGGVHHLVEGERVLLIERLRGGDHRKTQDSD